MGTDPPLWLIQSHESAGIAQLNIPLIDRRLLELLLGFFMVLNRRSRSGYQRAIPSPHHFDRSRQDRSRLAMSGMSDQLSRLHIKKGVLTPLKNYYFSRRPAKLRKGDVSPTKAGVRFVDTRH